MRTPFINKTPITVFVRPNTMMIQFPDHVSRAAILPHSQALQFLNWIKKHKQKYKSIINPVKSNKNKKVGWGKSKKVWRQAPSNYNKDEVWRHLNNRGSNISSTTCDRGREGKRRAKLGGSGKDDGGKWEYRSNLHISRHNFSTEPSISLACRFISSLIFWHRID